MRPPARLRLPDGRHLAYDDVGDEAGYPVLYLHGTPDSRLARPPDDGLAAAAGVRLLAVDRPGAGASDHDPDARPGSLGADLEVLLDHLGLERAGLLGWSSGGLFALAAAGRLGERVRALALVGTVPPVEAYDDPSVIAALDPARRRFVELARELPAAEVGAEVAPYLVPDPLTPALALDHVVEAAGERGRAELASVPGAAQQMALALEAAVAGGREGLVTDVRLQLAAGLDLATVGSPVRTWHGGHDGVSPPPVGRWLAARLPRARLEVREASGHHLLFPLWGEILAAVVSDGA